MNNGIMIDMSNAISCLSLDDINNSRAINIEFYYIGAFIFLINFIYILYNLFNKHNQCNILLWISSVIGIVLYLIGNYLYSFTQPIGGINIENIISVILRLSNFIIQLIIFILLIRNTIKNKKKEENPKCQE